MSISAVIVFTCAGDRELVNNYGHVWCTIILFKQKQNMAVAR